MELSPYDKITSLHSDSYNWKCRVGLQCVWKGMNREKTEFWGLNMVLIDDSNGRIHAFANSKYCDHLMKTLAEGNIYILSNFKVKDYLGDETYRPVRTNKHIYFTPHTTVQKDDALGLEIEQFAFDFFHFSDVQKVATDNRFLIDIIGKVQNIQPHIKSLKNTEEKTRLKFQISDGRFKVNITLFDNLGMEVEKELTRLDPGNIYMIIACAKVSLYEGEPSVTNYPATRIFINPDHYTANEFRTKMPKNLPIEEIEEEKPKEALQVLTVKDIKKLDSTFNEKLVNCQVIVKKVDEKANWYYARCTGCTVEIQKVNGAFKCNECRRVIPYPDKRFRVCTICSDETGSIAVIFPDDEVIRITGTDVIDIQAKCEEEKDEDKFPDILKCFIKQKYSITLQIHSDNTENGSAVYEAKEIHEVMDICDSSNTTKETLPDVTNDSIINDAGVAEPLTAHLSGTPQTGNSTTNKRRTRNVGSPVIYKMEENPKIKALKDIKKEKE